jgi:hypothetical protein
MEGGYKPVPEHERDSQEGSKAGLQGDDLVGTAVKEGQTSGRHLRSLDRLRLGELRCESSRTGSCKKWPRKQGNKTRLALEGPANLKRLYAQTVVPALGLW